MIQMSPHVIIKQQLHQLLPPTSDCLFILRPIDTLLYGYLQRRLTRAINRQSKSETPPTSTNNMNKDAVSRASQIPSIRSNPNPRPARLPNAHPRVHSRIKTSRLILPVLIDWLSCSHLLHRESSLLPKALLSSRCRNDQPPNPFGPFRSRTHTERCKMRHPICLPT